MDKQKEEYRFIKNLTLGFGIASIGIALAIILYLAS